MCVCVCLLLLLFFVCVLFLFVVCIVFKPVSHNMYYVFHGVPVADMQSLLCTLVSLPGNCKHFAIPEGDYTKMVGPRADPILLLLCYSIPLIVIASRLFMMRRQATESTL